MAALVETMFYTGKVPWHGEGNYLDNPPTTKEAVIQAGCDWDVLVQPIYTPAFYPVTMKSPLDGSEITEGRFVLDAEGRSLQIGQDIEKVPLGGAIRRATDGAFLGLCGPGWKPYQNRDAFHWFDPFVEKGLARLHTAGALDGGKVVWILAQIGNEKAIVGNDTVSQFLLLSVGHSGMSGSVAGPSGIRILPTPIRVVCANTLSMASRDESAMVKISHHARTRQRMDDLQGFIEKYLHNFDKTFEVFKELAHKDLTTVMVEEFLKEMFPDPAPGKDGKPKNPVHAIKKRDEIEALFNGSQIGDAEMKAGQRSAWSMYSAVTEWIDHSRGRDASRMGQAWFGVGSKIKSHALEALVAI